ncbi:Replication factor C subunit 5-like protein [Dinothrombium tinctorium]|uniref:Activator 1 subunit 5 n=1 Tax=Dinothrombium tinctorium TaxID=1965070 RepID=A0A3S3R2Z9_9ACAR|nr:Replication factor C subunit 5-like protein [Dinothrombium tinctorium]
MVSDERTAENLPWVEKYRPQSLSEVIAHEEIVKTSSLLPHLLLYGPPGTGKTTTILAIARRLFSPKDFNSMVLELNASDDRGINIVRNEILSFASTKTIFKSGFKLVILDEADAMTNDAQNALRRIIEKYTENTRFCLICNYLSKIIPALQSRCTRFRFAPLNSKQITPRLDFIIKQENIKVEESGKKALIELSSGDMRKVINVLQSTSLAFDVVNETNVYLCCGQPLKSDLRRIMEWLLNEPFTKIYKQIRELQKAKGLALQDIVTQVHVYVHEIDFTSEIKIEILEKLSAIELHLSLGGSEKLNLSSLISAFQTARDFNKAAEMNEMIIG